MLTDLHYIEIVVIVFGRVGEIELSQGRMIKKFTKNFQTNALQYDWKQQLISHKSAPTPISSFSFGGKGVLSQLSGQDKERDKIARQNLMHSRLQKAKQIWFKHLI